MKKRLIFLWIFAGAWISAQTFGPTGTTTLSLTVAPEAAISITTATTTLTSATVFAPFTGVTNFSYKIRTSQTTGTGHITLEVTTDFSPAGGPSVATPPTAGDALTYGCTVSNPATACTGSITASTTATTNVASFGAGANSAAAGNSGSIDWSLTDDPKYQSGAYTATVTFTISAT